MKKITLLIILSLMISAISMNAKEFSYDFTSKIASGWTVSPTPTGYETSGSIRGMQFNKAAATLTLKGAKQVSKIVVTASSNSAGQVMEVKVGSKSWGTETLAKEANADKTFTGTATDGDIVITVTQGTKSTWIKKIVVTASECSGGEDEGEDETELDPSYTYDEPTTVAASDLTATAYPFVQNNIKFEATAGVVNEDYFSCYAGGSITLTTTKAMKAIVINGYLKKGFEATASSGTIKYADSSDEEVEGDPVLAVTNINSKTLTLACTKQLRCYSVKVYFDENPEVEIDEGDDEEEEEGDYNHDYEPTTPTTLTVQFDSLYYSDYSDYLGYNYTSLYFVHNDYEMELGAYVATEAGKGIAPGTYPINATYNDNTIQASPGGDDYYDYPSYLCTDFKYSSEYESWYYETAYYLVSGTVKVENDTKGVKYTINAKTYYGSTINATFTGVAVDYNTIDIIKDINAETGTEYCKKLEGGRVVICKDGKKFAVDGRRID